MIVTLLSHEIKIAVSEYIAKKFNGRVIIKGEIKVKRRSTKTEEVGSISVEISDPIDYDKLRKS